jgi:hypothetical protein
MVEEEELLALDGVLSSGWLVFAASGSVVSLIVMVELSFTLFLQMECIGRPTGIKRGNAAVLESE